MRRSARRPTRWAVLGVGNTGRVRVQAISRDPRCSLVAVHGGRYADQAGVEVTKTVDAALAKAEAVAICVPVPLRPDLVRAALRAGRHVLVEAPLASSPDLAEELFELARKKRRRLHVAHVDLLKAAACTLRGRIHAEAVKRVAVRYDRPGPDDVPGDQLAVHAITHLHRVVDLAGPLHRIEAISPDAGSLQAELRLSSGAPVWLQVRQSPHLQRDSQLEILDHASTWLQEGDALFRNEDAQTLLEPMPATRDDQAWMMRHLLDGADPYVGKDRIVHVLRVTERLAAGSLGEVE